MRVVMRRPINFNPGPALLPTPALEQAQRELLDFRGTGMSVLEHSHRGAAYTALHDETLTLLRELLAIPASHRVLFLHGGAHQQFAMVPMNFRTDDHAGDYVITGLWAERAFEEAERIGKPRVAATTKVDGTFVRVPSQLELALSPGAPYVHLTSNNTIYGTQYQVFPDTGATPLIADMSSDIMARPVDVSKFGLIYACAQKNLGCAGVTVVIVNESLLAQARGDLPKIFRYATHVEANSLYNTAPTFPVSMMHHVLRWLAAEGGVARASRQNDLKAALLYAVIDESAGFYRSQVEPASRSRVNVVFRLPSVELEKAFVAESEQAGMVGLKGHRSVGGIRASIYNAMPMEGVEVLADFMRRFRTAH